MKPGRRDRRYKILITGRELVELKRFACVMVEAFGLDRRIENYKGTRPIGFFPWDLDCLEAVTHSALKDKSMYPGLSGPGYEAMKRLNDRIVRLHAEAYARD
jgi:hypothetical protein